jgi:hypothetical protein
MIVGALASDKGFAYGVERLLREYGFYCDEPAASKTLLEDSTIAAMHHDGRFFDIPYGIGNMRDFARRFADLLESACADEQQLRLILPALHICRSGRSDALVNRECFGDYTGLLDFMQGYDPAEILQTGTCMDLILGGSAGAVYSDLRSGIQAP